MYKTAKQLINMNKVEADEKRFFEEETEENYEKKKLHQRRILRTLIIMHY